MRKKRLLDISLQNKKIFERISQQKNRKINEYGHHNNNEVKCKYRKNIKTEHIHEIYQSQ